MQLDAPLNMYIWLTVNEYQQHCLQYLVKTVTQKREVDEQQKVVAARNVKINEEEITCKKLAEVAEADLKEAMPALEAAMKVVNGPMFILPGVENSWNTVPVFCYLVFCPCLFIADINMLSKLVIWHTAKSYSSMQFLEYLLLQNILDTEAVDHISLSSFDTTEELVALASVITFCVISYSGNRALTNKLYKSLFMGSAHFSVKIFLALL